MKPATVLTSGSALLLFTLTLALTSGVVQAQQLAPLRFTLNWVLEASNAPFLLAQQKGYFAEEGLDVTIDAGEGSSAVITRIGSDAYDAGFGDINTMIEFNAANPENPQRMVYMIYNRPPLAVISLAKSGINQPKDLEGKKVGAPVSDTAYRMFPLFADAAGIDADKINFDNVAPNLREPMLLRGQVDAITGFPSSSYPNLVGMGVPPEDIVLMYYTGYGVSMYSNGLIVSEKLIKERPEAVRGLVKAVNRALQDTIADPTAPIGALLQRDRLANRDLEVGRMRFLLEHQVITDEVRELGLGAVSPERLEASIQTVAKSFGIENPPSAEEIFDDRFLPAAAERQVN